MASFRHQTKSPEDGMSRGNWAGQLVACVLAVLLGHSLAAGIAQAAPGGLDPSFSADGRQTTDFGTGFSRANAVALQPDGKIVVAGYFQQGYGLARYNADGSLDTSFSGDGVQITDS